MEFYQENLRQIILAREIKWLECTMKFVESFADLEAYKLSEGLSNEIFELTLNFPKEERYSLVDQIRRSSRSIGAQVAEAWARRGYEKHFVSKLTDLIAEQLETQHWIRTSLNCHYISPECAASLLTLCERVGSMLNAMIVKAHLFCRPPKK